MAILASRLLKTRSGKKAHLFLAHSLAQCFSKQVLDKMSPPLAKAIRNPKRNSLQVCGNSKFHFLQKPPWHVRGCSFSSRFRSFQVVSGRFGVVLRSFSDR